jgi:hypothetical protein
VQKDSKFIIVTGVTAASKRSMRMCRIALCAKIAKTVELQKFMCTYHLERVEVSKSDITDNYNVQ